MNRTFLRIVGAVISILTAETVGAQTTLQTTNELSAAPADIWRDGIGTGFQPWTYSFGALVGAGLGTPVFGSTLHHDLALANVNAAFFLPEFFPNHRFAGNWETRIELFGGSEWSPNVRYLVGTTVDFRYDFVTGSRLVPFFEGGAGFSGTDIGQPDLGELYNFNVQVGFGTYYFLRRDLALSLGYRWLHFSDAGITHQNHGTNTQMGEVGITWFF